MAKTIKFSTGKDGIATLAIDVPDHSMNVLNEAFIGELDGLIDKIADDKKIKGAVITSAKEGNFVAGADVALIAKVIEYARNRSASEAFAQAFRLNQLFRKLETCGKPFAAAVNGLTLGGGFELALACHYRVAVDDDTVKIAFPEVQLGILPGAGGTQRLPRLAGLMAALQYLSTGKGMTPKEAVGLGIFQKLAGKGKVVDAAKEWLEDSPDPVAPWDKKGFKYPGGGGAMHPKAVQTFMGANAMAQAKTLHNYPAVEAILSSVYEGSIVPFDTALRIESKYFTRLIRGPEAGNMVRTLFVSKQAADKLQARPKGEPERKTKKLGMLGAGMMGSGIAYVSAAAGIEVILVDQSKENAEKGKAYSEKLVEKGIGKNKLTKEDGKKLLSRIKPTDDYGDLRGCDLIIEAVFEDADVKEEAIKKTEKVIGKECFFATNTSTIPITSLAGHSKRPERFIGIHFFSPVEKMMLVEIIMGEKTGDGALAKALDYVRQIRKTPVVVNDSRGFYTSRCFGTYVQEGVAMLREGVKPALIENAGRMAGMPVGPLAVGDEVSLELMLRIQRQTEKALGKDYQPHPADQVVVKFVEKLGRKGRKNGKGFYEYPEDGRKYLWPELARHYPADKKQPPLEELKTRFLYRQAVEAARCREEKVLRDTPSGDVAAILGWGFAPFTGGPFSFIDTVGAKAFVREAERLAGEYGERFAPPKSLKEMAARGKTFYPA